MSIDEFEVGVQPCDSFLPERLSMFNLAARPLCPVPGCSARRAFCNTCSHFHHAGGEKSCPTNKTTLRPEPRSENEWEE